LSPAWTTDWMSAKGREALRDYGIAPPVHPAPGTGNSQVIDITALMPHRTTVPCPRCSSRKTRLLSQFGSTACKALYQCSDCLEPFDYFKPH
jgi:ring-1,2-phenylacetyl-CoA epoxidase subunit PaaD